MRESQPAAHLADASAAAPALRKMLFPLIALAIGGIASVVSFVFIKDKIQDEAQLRFERQASDTKHVIEARITSYFEVLHGLKALFSRSGAIPRAEFHRHVAALDLARRYPGFDALSYVEHVTRDAKAGFEARVRRDTSLDPRGYPDFAIRPAGDRPEYYVVSYLEPVAGNERSFGLDISSNPASTNSQAVAIALAAGRDTGAPSSSGQLFKPGVGRASMLLAIRLAVYRSGMPVETVEQRRAAYIGAVGAGFRVRELMRGALEKSKHELMRFALYDAGPAQGYAAKPGAAPGQQERLLFDSEDLLEPPAAGRLGGKAMHFRTVLPMEVAGRMWEVHFRAPREALISDIDVALPWLALCGGALTSLLLFGLFYSLASSRVRAQHLALHDSLTLLPNRHFFRTLLNHGISRSRRQRKQLAVFFIDLDGFKKVNDTLGHAGGDALLREVGSRLKKCLRESDVVARMGGDEFLVLLEDLDGPTHLPLVARKILDALAKPYALFGQERHVTGSIGISTYPADGKDEQTLMKNADTAMYRAKEGGKNSFQFHSPGQATDTWPGPDTGLD